MVAAGKTLANLGLTTLGASQTMIQGLAVDSRDVRMGYLFAALRGTRMHGAEFAEFALRQGANVILTDPEGADLIANTIPMHDAYICVVDDPRQSLAGAAALFFGAQPPVMVAVTGTNGKTSVATFCRQIWTHMGLQAVNLGTTGVEGAWSAPLKHTTPEPITLHRTLAQAAAAGVTHAAMEASSHGLFQKRLDGVVLSAAGFTNFTQDHLDYHGTFEAYFAAKASVFDRVLAPKGCAVINVDDGKGSELLSACVARGQSTVTVGRNLADLQILGQKYDATGQDILFSWRGDSYQVKVPLVGGFQGENLMLATAMVLAAGGEPKKVFACLNAIRPVRGRMELAATRGNGASIYVDYAHTPDAVTTALMALRPHVMGRLVVVLGAGGDRDPGKRILMGKAAADFADITFVTDDNPRTEDPASIRAMIMMGVPNASEVADRAEAILRAVDCLQPGDTLLIAGKGHEICQIIGDDTFPFDDVEQASIAVAALEGAY
ncbi:MAG: UDP-N-acetylmuramoyl-L-alanyl-D-glutamate--2,6-diaminopimelate ligase [Planktomarina sp.]|nr:UDP-N-acetylmuramoyl-L-alanyl-D-glutamate--2,6-diaminopimelate ligase [Planktomarina sp.]